MTKKLHQRLEALEQNSGDNSLRLPTLAEFYAGYGKDGDVLPNGEVIRLPPGGISWGEFYRTGGTGPREQRITPEAAARVYEQVMSGPPPVSPDTRLDHLSDADAARAYLRSVSRPS
jgi:hypothetical protein